MTKNFNCLCHLCYPNAKEYCELIEGCWLFENEGKWGLMCQPGHRDEHAILFFPEKPTLDPDPECEYDDKWLDMVLDWSEKILMSPCDGHFLVEGCKKAGWEKGILLLWLYDFAGKKLLELESVL